MRPQQKTAIEIPAPDLRLIEFDVEGLSPLMVHAWSAKAIRQMEESKKPKAAKRPPRDPVAEYEAAMYRLPNGSHAFPAASFRLAAVSACRMIDGLPMTQARILFFCPDQWVELEAEPTMDTRCVRLETGVAQVRYRPMYWPWRCKLTVRYNAGATTAEQIANLLALAGECIGVGEYRPERGGSFGRFTIGGNGGTKQNGHGEGQVEAKPARKPRKR